MNYYGNISRLRYFQAVCVCGTMTKAAESLHISQPSLTASIKELEKELGISLFHRSKNMLTLTEQGEHVLKKTNSMLESLDRYYSEILEYGDHAEREVTIGAPPIIGTVLIPCIFENAPKQCADVNLKLHECTTTEAFTLIENNIINIAMLTHHDVPNDYNYKVAHESELYYWMNKNHPLANRSSITAVDICEYPLVMVSSDSYHYWAAVERFKEEGVAPNVKLYTRQLATIFKILEKSIIGTITYKDITHPGETFVGIPFSPPIPVKLSVVWDKKDYVTPAQKKVIKFLSNLDWSGSD